tara:strand:- start:215 stop:364 length:150 start_codon:yes stop_codon:yes gene_type:complete
MDEVSAHSSMSDFSEANLGPISWDQVIASWEDIVMDFRIPMVFTEVTIS